MGVIGVGDADIDIYLNVAHLPSRDEKILADGVEMHPGGMVANMLACLSRLGTPASFHGLVGDDEFGRQTLADLRAYGVNVDGAVIKSDTQTYFCVVMLDSSGEKALIVAPTPAIFPEPADINEAYVAQASHLHTTGSNVETALRATELARAYGLTVSLDLEPTANFRSETRFQQLLAGVDVLFVNQRAVAQLGGNNGSLEAAAAQLTALGPKMICVTKGSEGVHLVAGDQSFAIPAFPVPVIDSTGAGDCFAAGFVHGFLKGWPPPMAALFASATASLNLRRRGGHAGAPTANEVNDLLNAHPTLKPIPQHD